ncbi:MAG TPA: hypothetical protein VIH86_07670 [Puia sp.]|jgi:hypothetical protein
MKKLMKVFFMLSFAMYFNLAFSQTTSLSSVGLYKNEDDFNSHKLTYESNCSSTQHAIKTNNFFASQKLIVKTNDKKVVLLKKDFFGYHSCNGKDYRFYKNQALEIIDITSFYLYKYTGLEPGAGGKGYATVTRYYFSKTGKSDVQSLTVANLEETFSDNAKFRYALENYSRNDKSLMDYDSYGKMYKVKYLFAESLK